MKRAVFAGTFDPFTLGHAHIVRRAAALFGHVTVAVSGGTSKRTLFSLEERTAIAESETRGIPNVDVRPFPGLLRDFVVEGGYEVVVRGIRGESDFPYEFQMAGVNSLLMPGIDTVFLQTSPEFRFVAASYAREVASFGGDVSRFVSPAVAERLREKFRTRQ